MANIKVYLKTGEIVSYDDRDDMLKYEGVFVIVKGGYGKEIAYPATDVIKVEKEAARRSW